MGANVIFDPFITISANDVESRMLEIQEDSVALLVTIEITGPSVSVYITDNTNHNLAIEGNEFLAYFTGAQSGEYEVQLEDADTYWVIVANPSTVTQASVGITIEIQESLFSNTLIIAGVIGVVVIIGLVLFIRRRG